MLALGTGVVGAGANHECPEFGIMGHGLEVGFFCARGLSFSWGVVLGDSFFARCVLFEEVCLFA